MSKTFTKDDVIQNKKEAIRLLDRLLEGYINDPAYQHLKKANLISYWIKDYVNYINFEEKFDPTKNISYKRGNIVKLNFGFNIGSEYGGLHYGIVLDNNNHHNSPVITVIPLTSIKNDKEIHDNSVELGNELYKSLKIKFDTIEKALKDELQEINETISLFTSVSTDAKKNITDLENLDPNSKEYLEKLATAQTQLELVEKFRNTYKQKEQHTNQQLEYLEKIGDEIIKMKEGSIALVNQITTVSKIRIFDPRNLKGVLSGISLSPQSMDKINQKLIDLYVFK